MTPLSAAFNPNGVTVAGGQTTIVMGTIIDSISASLASLKPFCTAAPACTRRCQLEPVNWTNTGGPAGCDTPGNQVYCSSAHINVAPITSLSICPGSRATFISQGQITFGANTAIAASARDGRPEQSRRRVVRHLGAASCSGGFDVFMGSAGTYVLQGSVYAPNGCIAFGGAGGVGGFQMTGQMVGRNLDLQMSPGPPGFHRPGRRPQRQLEDRSLGATGVDGRTTQPRRQRSRGVAALELALSLTFLVPLLMGMLDFGYYFYIGTNAEEAARAGVREAVLASGGATCAPTGRAVKAAGELPATGTGAAGLHRRRGVLLHERAAAQHGRRGRQHDRLAHLLDRAGESDLDHQRAGRLLARDHVLQVDDAGQRDRRKSEYTATLTSD